MQDKRTLEELIDPADPAWPVIRGWFEDARCDIEILPCERACGEDVLLHLQVTTRSELGAVAFMTGGILIDHGWLRFIGAGSERMKTNFLTWTAGGGMNTPSIRRSGLPQVDHGPNARAVRSQWLSCGG